MSEYDENFCRACEHSNCAYAKSVGQCTLASVRATEICPFCGAEGCQWDCQESSPCKTFQMKEMSVPEGSVCLECKHYEEEV